MASVEVIRDNLDKMRKAVKELTMQRVMVGVPSTTAAREPEPGEKTVINNAALGYIHEFGAPEAHIPARPFLYPGIESKKDDITAILKTAGTNALDGNLEGMTNSLNAAGLVGQSAVQAQIVDGTFESLKPATLAARRRHGRVGEKPLIDTGALRQAITFVIRKISGN